MRSLKTLILLVSTTCLCLAGESLKQDSSYASIKVKNSIFMEVAGNGIVLSANYERLVYNSLGLRIGIGATFGIGSTLPMMVNYYLGERNKLELGAGLVYLPVWNDDFPVGSEKSFLAVGTLGYKNAKDNGGIIFRASLTPLYDFSENKALVYGGISFGFAF